MNARFANDIDIGVDTGNTQGEDQKQSNTIISNRNFAKKCAPRRIHGVRSDKKVFAVPAAYALRARV
jgi:hypothetical protein